MDSFHNDGPDSMGAFMQRIRVRRELARLNHHAVEVREGPVSRPRAMRARPAKRGIHRIRLNQGNPLMKRLRALRLGVGEWQQRPSTEDKSECAFDACGGFFRPES